MADTVEVNTPEVVEAPATPPLPEYALVKQAILGAISGDITPLNVVLVVTAAMNLLTKQSQLTGPAKKQLLLDVLSAVLVEQGMDDVDRQQIMYIVPGFIDQFAYVSSHSKNGNCCVIV